MAVGRTSIKREKTEASKRGKGVTVTVKGPVQKNNVYRRVNGKVLEGSEVVRLSNYSPDTVVGVQSSRIYAQIAKAGRDPKLWSSREKLIEVLVEADTIDSKTGCVVLHTGPTYIPMKVKDVVVCFGKAIRRMPVASFVDISEKKY